MLSISTFQNVSADTQQTVVLDGQSVIIRFVYNVRNEYFTLTLTDQNGNTLYGIKVVPNWLLLNQYKGFTDLVGDLVVFKVDEDAGNENILATNIALRASSGIGTEVQGGGTAVNLDGDIDVNATGNFAGNTQAA